MIAKLLKPIDVASGSIIMAMGIFLLGAAHQFTYIEEQFDYLFSILIVIWIVMLCKFIYSLFTRDYFKTLWNQPILSFALGTWIAATSAVTILLKQQFPDIIQFKWLVFVNCIAWFVYLVITFIQLKKIIVTGSLKNLHGIILLTTVSTQSIACLLMVVLDYTNILIILFGILLYLISIGLMVTRFITKGSNLHEWKNTDCIIHGAVSISGLAMTMSGVFELNILLIVWYTALCLFIIIEIIEILRAISRIKLYGIRAGIFTYHTSQWARNLTFGMFYYFSYTLINGPGKKEQLNFQNYVMDMLGWIVLILLIVETILWIYPKKK